MDILQSLRRIYEVYSRNFLVVFLATLLTILLSVLTFGILAGPLFGGLILICLKLLREEKADYKEIFKHFDNFLPTLILIILAGLAGFLISIIGSIPMIGWIFSLVVNPALFLITSMALAFVVDQNSSPVEALTKSVKSFITNPTIVWLYSLVIGVLSSIGALLFYFPVVFTAPIGVIGAALAYRELSVREPAGLKLEKKQVQIGISVLAGLLVLGLVFRFFLGFGPSFPGRGVFNRSQSNFSERMAGGILSKITGEQVKVGRDGDSVSIGGVTFGEKIPKGYPRDVALYPKAQVESYLGAENGDNSAATFSTSDSTEQVAEFYQRELADEHWKIETTYFGELTMILFEKAEEGRSGSVAISSDEENTTIILTLKKE